MTAKTGGQDKLAPATDGQKELAGVLSPFPSGHSFHTYIHIYIYNDSIMIVIMILKHHIFLGVPTAFELSLAVAIVKHLQKGSGTHPKIQFF